ncbi:MAG: hypothetical protein QM740_19180 [Acidovorax sp.]
MKQSDLNHLRFLKDWVFRDNAEKKLAALEGLRPKVRALLEQHQSAGGAKA